MKRASFTIVVLLLSLFAVGTAAQMGGGVMGGGVMGGGMMGGSPGQSGGVMGVAAGGSMIGIMTGSGTMMPGTAATGVMSGGMVPGGMMGAIGGMFGEALNIGPDGTAYFLSLDLTNTASPKTKVTATAVTNSNSSQWAVSVGGIATQLAIGTDRLVLATVSQATQTTTAAPDSKLLVLSQAAGSQLLSIDVAGMVTALRVQTVNGTQLAYVIHRQVTTSTSGSASSQAKLTIYRLDSGSVVKDVALN